MGILQVRAYFETNGIPERIIEFAESSATVALAARALGVEEKLIAKTLSFDVAGEPILIVTAGDTRIDNRKYKDTFSHKARLLSADEALKATGHPVGGVCPFALAGPVTVYLDVSLKRFETVYPAAGSAASAVAITPGRLQEITGAEWIDVCKLPGE
ncbi:MAG: YbaK/EbsC family protein [Clostridiales bacterium]|jgi:prolyl-tRNA editing enzyme YbaK/EbsC (Cys-tRNA(Pro) deacylase)|nr:YbaK/EbsC family protein [Clostridiales bacterium]